MVREIGGPGIDPTRSDTLRDALKPVPQLREKTTPASESETTEGVTLSGDLNELINRVKQADNIRKDRVHEVMQKLQNGRLVTPESIREAARQLLEGGV